MSDRIQLLAWLYSIPQMILDRVIRDEKKLDRVRKEGFILSTIENIFYPRNRASKIPIGDKLVTIFLIIGTIVGLLQLIAAPSLEDNLNIAYYLFTAFFFVEAILRFSVKGFSYIKSLFGILDIVFIVFEVTALVLIYTNKISAEYAVVIKVARIMRLLRLARFTVYSGGFSSRFLEFKLRAMPLLKSFSTLIVIMVFLILVIYIKDPNSSFLHQYFPKYFSPPIEKMEPNTVIDSSNVIVKGSYKVRNDRDPVEKYFGLLIALFILILTNILMVLFTPTATDRIQEKLIEHYRSKKRGHVIIYIEEGGLSILEEISYVFDRDSNYPIVLLFEEGISNSLHYNIPDSVDIVSGSINSAKDCSRINILHAKVVIIYSSNSFNSRRYSEILSVLQSDSGTQLFSAPTFPLTYWIDENYDNNKGYFEVINNKVSINHISYTKFKDSMKVNIWKDDSIQKDIYNHIHERNVYSNLFTFSLAETSTCHHEKNEFERSLLKSIEEEENLKKNIRIKKSGSHPIVKIYLVGRKLSTEYFLLISHIESVVAKELNWNNLSVLVLVSDYYLTKHNPYFKSKSSENGINICIFSIEYALGLALLHDIECPGSFELWVSSYDNIKTISYNKSIYAGCTKHYSYNVLNKDIIGIIKDNRYLGFISHRERITIVPDRLIIKS